MSTPADRNAAAEQRAVDENHRAWLDRDHRGAFLRVVSDTDESIAYRVGCRVGPADRLIFRCEPITKADQRPTDFAHRDVVGRPGELPCKHAARAARRLRREGFATTTDGGLWVATAAATVELEPEIPEQPADPFAGLPSDGSPL